MQISKNGLHPRIEKVIGEFLTHTDLFIQFEYFGQYGLYLQYREENSIPTAGVTVEDGRITFLWNREFIESLTDLQLRFLYLHEIYHLISNHLGRISSQNMDRMISNLAGDMIINEEIRQEFTKNIEVIPGCVEWDKSYKGERTLEDVYEWMMQQNQKNQQNQNGQQEKKDQKGQQEKKDQKGQQGQNPGCTQREGLKPGETLDSHGNLGDVSPEVMESLAKEIHETLKARGIGSADLHKKLEKIGKTKENYLKNVRRCITQMKGRSGSVRSFRKANRRGFKLIKGKTKLQNEIAVVLDTSGSMWNEMSKILAAINREGFRMVIIPTDTEVHEKSITICESAADLKKVKPAGGGGTELQPGINWATKNMRGRPVVVLTDGFCDDLDFRAHPGSMVLTTEKKPGVTGNCKVITIK